MDLNYALLGHEMFLMEKLVNEALETIYKYCVI